ncbi:hypothetical protein LTI14_10865 [Nesterenkonia sp. YGD6]|uniref:hypothetical protein n=1 Tax=Nesterenkonia sp. YGD6 TaxID=2901231 RepID=UPI001F4CA262|nr:hypothetical protein [Nesterenkonia sp. YGD6]MCH8563709.1 hypothetical protein [Nesterenkonia sp. YGD6]
MPITSEKSRSNTVMNDHEIRAYGPNYDTDYLAVDLDKKIRSVGGATIIVFGEDPVLRAMQSRALADSLGLKLTKNRLKAEDQHDPAIGVTVALHCADPTLTSDALVREWVLDPEFMGPRILIVEVAENAELAVSALGACALFVKVDSFNIPPAGMGSTTTVASDIADYDDPNLVPGFTSMRNYSTLMAELADTEVL